MAYTLIPEVRLVLHSLLQ